VLVVSSTLTGLAPFIIPTLAGARRHRMGDGRCPNLLNVSFSVLMNKLALVVTT
jgi:hypothetical protein